MASVEVINVFKTYPEGRLVAAGHCKPALNGVSLRLAEGETVSVVGSSGCGKSTLLKVIAGLEPTDAGRILYNGQDATRVRPQERGVGMVFQDYALYPAMKGKGNLAYYFETHHRTEAETEQRMRETAQRMGVGFAQLLGRLPDTLSGGEKQRVAIARCIVREPQLFLMDEPITNLDAKLREQTRIEIRKLLRRFALTTMYVTHDQQEAIFMGDRLAVMRDGSIEQVGAFDELYYTPANLFVATFIGSPPMAVIPAVIADGEAISGQARWPLPHHVTRGVASGPVRIGVRPAGWRFDPEHGAVLRVRHHERQPAEQATLLHGSVAGADVTVVAEAGHPIAAEERVVPDWNRAYFFAAASEAPLLLPGVPDVF